MIGIIFGCQGEGRVKPHPSASQVVEKIKQLGGNVEMQTHDTVVWTRQDSHKVTVELISVTNSCLASMMPPGVTVLPSDSAWTMTRLDIPAHPIYQETAILFDVKNCEFSQLGNTLALGPRVAEAEKALEGEWREIKKLIDETIYK